MHVGRFVTAGVPRLGRGKRSRSPKTRSKQGNPGDCEKVHHTAGLGVCLAWLGERRHRSAGGGGGAGRRAGRPGAAAALGHLHCSPGSWGSEAPCQETPVPEPRLRPTPTWDARLSLPSRPRHCHSPGGRAGNGTDLTESGNCAPSLTGPSKLPSVCSGNGDVVTTRTPGSWGGGCGKSGAKRPGSSPRLRCPPPPPPLPACRAGTARTRPRAGGNIYSRERPGELSPLSDSRAAQSGRRGGSRQGHGADSRPGPGRPGVATTAA